MRVKEKNTMSFLEAAGRQTKDIRSFLREAAGGNSLKYKPDKGQRHYVYIPYRTVATVDDAGNTNTHKEIIAVSAAVHEWQGLDGKYKATVCLKEVVRNAEDGSFINDGSCPFCDSVSKGWDVYRYRFEQEELNCGKTGDDLAKHMDGLKKNFADERKSKEAKDYIYLLVVKYRTDITKNYMPILDQSGIPEYDLKVMKLSASRVEKLQQQLENSGADFVGSEVAFEYPNETDARLVVSQSTTAPIFESKQFVRVYAGLLEHIQNDVDKFEWNGIEKSFIEWQGMSSMEAEKTVNQLFGTWDEFQGELKVNPNAKYLEYVGAKSAGVNPALGSVPTAPQLGVPTAAPSVAPNIPGMAPNIPGVAPNIPGVAPVAAIGGVPDVNEIFGAGAAQAPSVPASSINL